MILHFSPINIQMQLGYSEVVHIDVDIIPHQNVDRELAKKANALFHSSDPCKLKTVLDLRSDGAFFFGKDNFSKAVVANYLMAKAKA